MRSLIVDDNKVDRDALRGMLDALACVEVLGEAGNLHDARRFLAEHTVDIVFLDIELGRENGFALLEEGMTNIAVVFTTVHSGYGGQAFDADAVDYLIKPITEDRLLRALHRVAASLGRETRPLTRVPIHRSGSTRRFLPLEMISAVLAEGNYSRVLTGSRDYPDHRRLRDWEKLLSGLPFERLDRSTLLRHDQIESLTPCGNGAAIMLRNSAVPLDIGRTAYERLKEIIGK
jgi:two-component system LytT family response regulator